MMYSMLMLLLAAFALGSIVTMLVVMVLRARERGAYPQPKAASSSAYTALLERRGQRRSRFAWHAGLYIGYALLVGVFLTAVNYWRSFMTIPNTGDLLLILGVWGILFIGHGARFFTEEAGDRALADQLTVGKPKRDYERLVIVDEEGELVIDETEAPRAQARH